MVQKTLDPDSWADSSALGHRMLDEMMSWLATLRERPVWRPIPDRVRARFDAPVPRAPEGAEAAWEDFLELVLPYPMGNVHPRFWGWVNGTGTVVGMLAEMLAAGLNPNASGFEHSGTLVERQVIEWCRQMMGMPESAGGLLVTGGSMANLLGLATARNLATGLDVRRRGVAAASRPPVLYASVETHSSVLKAVELLGLGSESLRRIDVDDRFRIDVGRLEGAIAEDRRAGLAPFCVVGNAGTVNTGAVDDLEALVDLCRREELWFHVDGAFGALAALSPSLRSIVAGIERADSLAFDLHKWMYLPYDIGCVLLRDGSLGEQAFDATPAYLDGLPGGLSPQPPEFSRRGIELSRGFRALKAWMCLKAHGVDAFAELVEQNVEQAAWLADRVECSELLELGAPVPLNVVCLRGAVGERGEERDRLNRRLLVELQEDGVAVLSSTELHGAFWMRAAITNHRTRVEDLEVLVEELERRVAEAAA